MSPKNKNTGCGCTSIPISVLLVLLGLGYWGFTQLHKLNLSQFLPEAIAKVVANAQPTTPPVPQPAATLSSPSPTISVTPKPQRSVPLPRPTISATPNPQRSAPLPRPTISATPEPQSAQSPSPAPRLQNSPTPQTPWEKKAIRGIYLSRYQVTNNASEQMIRSRVRYYRQQGMNTIIHGVWGNGCTMYNSDVMQKTFGFKSCPNQFQDQWLVWLIDEAHKQGMQVHAYFEKGIKIDENSPIFDLAVARRWIVPGVDRTYPSIDHYVLDVEIPEVSSLFKQISVEFVRKYPQIDAVQWDDYLGYHAALPGKVDRTARLTTFVQQMRSEIKKQNPRVSFDLCHHNPYWGKRYFAADWQNWGIDRAFIQIYNDANFKEELNYARNYEGVAVSDTQLHRLKELVNDSRIRSILVFPAKGKPEEAAAAVNKVVIAP